MLHITLAVAAPLSFPTKCIVAVTLAVLMRVCLRGASGLGLASICILIAICIAVTGLGAFALSSMPLQYTRVTEVFLVTIAGFLPGAMGEGSSRSTGGMRKLAPRVLTCLFTGPVIGLGSSVLSIALSQVSPADRSHIVVWYTAIGFVAGLLTALGIVLPAMIHSSARSLD